MIVFLSLFLGLVSGTRPVELVVEPPVTRVELQLDGRPAAELRGEPWTAPVDLGEELAPHRLEAVGYDADGVEVGRTAQWLNLPRGPAEARLAIERDEEGRQTAVRLAWKAIDAERPVAMSLTVDGQPLAMEGDRAPLPPLAADAVHVISAELLFASGDRARADARLGGAYGDEVSSALTPVQVEVDRPAALERPSQARGWLEVAGRPAEVVAVESGPLGLYAVVERSAADALHGLGADLRSRVHASGVHFSGADVPGDEMYVVRLPRHFGDEAVSYDSSPRRGDKNWLGAMAKVGGPLLRHASRQDDRLFLVRPTTDRHRGPGGAYKLFGVSQPIPSDQVSATWLLSHLVFPDDTDRRQRLTDAAAIAGLQAETSGRPRAVLLLLGPGSADDGSHYSPATVRRYLERLRLPLAVWYVEKRPGAMLESERQAAAEADERARAAGETPETREQRWQRVRAAWPEAVSIADLGDWLGAHRTLRDRLDHQRLLWIEGEHSPAEVKLVGAPRGVRFAALGSRPADG